MQTGKVFFVSMLIFMLLPTAFSQQIYLTKSGTASFVSDAPLEVIRASTNELQGAINLDDRTFAFVIDNKSFKGFNSPLQQEHFYENYMQVQDYPTSSFNGKIIEKIDLNSNAEQEVRAKGILNIHGVEQERIIKGTIQKSGDQFIIKADFTVPLEDHNIKIPKVVYQKIAEVINVTVEATLSIKKP
jgi:polyisoprenoid-binding protein YceI